MVQLYTIPIFKMGTLSLYSVVDRSTDVTHTDTWVLTLAPPLALCNTEVSYHRTLFTLFP